MPVLNESIRDTDEIVDGGFKAALESGVVKKGQGMVITAGAPVGVPGTANLIKAEVLK